MVINVFVIIAGLTVTETWKCLRKLHEVFEHSVKAHKLPNGLWILASRNPQALEIDTNLLAKSLDNRKLGKSNKYFPRRYLKTVLEDCKL